MRRFFRPLRTSLLMLLLAALVGVPVLDALACALEPDAVTAVHTPAAAHGDDADDSGGSHNHCHHANLSLPASVLAVSAAPRPVRWQQAGDAAPATVAQDGVKRPPKA